MRARVTLGARRGRLRGAARTRPALAGVAFFLALAVAVLIAKPSVFGQTTVFGVVSGSYFALGAGRAHEAFSTYALVSRESEQPVPA